MRKRELLLLGCTVCAATYSFCTIAFWQIDTAHERNALQKAAQVFENEKDHTGRNSSSDDSEMVMRDLNKDYVCYLEIPAINIHLPIVQTDDNQHYLSYAFDGTFSTQGTPFFDSGAAMSDAVRLIYGHWVSYDAQAMFSPLGQLEEWKNALPSFWLHFPGYDEYYDIVHVFRMHKINSTFDLQKRSFRDENDFYQWITSSRNEVEYERLKKYKLDDKFVLLQTCTSNEDEFLITIGIMSNPPASVY